MAMDKRNTIIQIGVLGAGECYLNLPKEKAIEMYAQSDKLYADVIKDQGLEAAVKVVEKHIADGYVSYKEVKFNNVFSANKLYESEHDTGKQVFIGNNYRELLTLKKFIEENPRARVNARLGSNNGKYAVVTVNYGDWEFSWYKLCKHSRKVRQLLKRHLDYREITYEDYVDRLRKGIKEYVQLAIDNGGFKTDPNANNDLLVAWRGDKSVYPDLFT
jgi:hypothetical protein